jgi:diguanylate cyclase (GGDEF)-like protein
MTASRCDDGCARGEVPVEDLRLAERARRRLVQVLEDDRPEPARWLSRLRAWSDEEAQPAFSHCVRLLFHLELPDGEAEALMANVLAHRASIAKALRRDPGLRVAGVDFLSNVDVRLANPKIVEMEDFERTERRARTDVLTGLQNRRVFRAAFDHEVRRARRYRAPLSLILLDVDHFKEINDGHGHLCGDQVLARLGAIVRRSIREADVGCRFGGEEIAIVLPETPRLGAYAVAERIRRRVEETFAETEIAGIFVAVTVSGGVACLPQDGTTSHALIERADRALYLAKGAGRNRVVAYHEEKRGEVRYPARDGVQVRVIGADGAPTEARLIDVSRTGALVQADRLPPPTGRLQIEVDKPLPVEHLRGHVVRVETATDAVPARRAGMAFESALGDDLLRGRLAANVNPPRGGRGMRR